MIYLLPLQSPMVGRILDGVPGHTSIGRSRNFVHLVTGHTPGRINRNGTVYELMADQKAMGQPNRRKCTM